MNKSGQEWFETEVREMLVHTTATGTAETQRKNPQVKGWGDASAGY